MRAVSSRSLLAAIFEELELEDPNDDHDWTIDYEQHTWRCTGLASVGAEVSQAERPVVVVDPFGHSYRPRIPRNRPLARHLKGRPLYIEIKRRLPGPLT
ncbi:hypothetical protein [Sinomonas susongensis]|uniref:hypothetical protein n=1 Tax=Sinomonas susongensis TaxID=1324851 RepID=UPI001485C403|nr:hypothetical protein [Sinomonas susongensis]